MANPDRLIDEAELVLNETVQLKRQPPKTLFRLRVVEIGLPLLTSIASILLIMRYPLTESRSYEIKKILKQRRGESVE